MDEIGVIDDVYLGGSLNLNIIMFCSQLYESSTLISLCPKGEKRIQHYLPLSTSERQLLIATLHMLIGMPSPIYIRNGSRFVLTEQPLELTHLTGEGLAGYLKEFAQQGNQLQFLREEARRIYAMPNSLLKAFAEAVLGVVGKVQEEVTGRLKVLQQESGRLERSEQEYQRSNDKPITLLSLLQAIKANAPILTFTISALSRLALRDNPSASDLQTAVLFLLNLYHESCSRQYLLGGQLGPQLHFLFGGVMRGYLAILSEWLEMDEAALAMKTHLGFFIDLDQTLALEEERIFDVKRITRREAVPQIFRSSYERVVELGKTIQFIKLYFEPEQRQQYRVFMAIPQHFAPLYTFIGRLQCQQAPKPFFAPKKVTYQTLSSKLSGMARPAITMKTLSQKENPFQMYQKLTGVLPLRSEYKYTSKDSKKIVNSTQIFQESSQVITSGLDTNSQFQALLHSLLDAISAKCLTILQQQRIRSSIDRTLVGIKKIMLFQQGDFIQEFMELARQIFEKPSEKISRNNIQRLMQEAIKSSAAQSLPQVIRQNISFSFLKDSKETTGIKAWRIFSMAYRPQKPTHCIFTPRVMADYGLLSNILFSLRHCQAVLSLAWSAGGINSAGLGGVLKARNAVHHYIKALQGFLFNELQVVWGELLEGIGATGNVLTILELNERALSRIRAISFENQPLCNCLLALVKIVDRFKSIQNSLENQMEEGLRNDVEQIWSWFVGMVDQSKHIPHFCDTFDFRCEYSL